MVILPISFSVTSIPCTQEADISSLNKTKRKREGERDIVTCAVIPYIAEMCEDIRHVCRKFSIRVVFRPVGLSTQC